MAVKLAKKNNQYNVQRRTFYIDSADDLESVEAEYDCGIGDLAELPDGTVYCRHSDGYDGDLWEEKGSSGGGSSGGGGGQGSSNVLVVGVNLATNTLDKTWQEIYDAPYCVIQGRDDVDKIVSNLLVLTILMAGENQYVVNGFDPENPQPVTFIATSASGYPALLNSQ